MAISIHTAVTTNAGQVAPGTMPKTRRMPGAAEKPIVRINWPTSARVPLSGIRRVPISKVTSAQVAHATSARPLMYRTPGADARRRARHHHDQQRLPRRTAIVFDLFIGNRIDRQRADESHGERRRDSG